MEASQNEESWRTWTEIQPCPAVSVQEVDAAEKSYRSEWLAKFGRKVGAIALCGVTAVSALAQVQSDYSASRWPASYAQVEPAPGSENIVSDGTANLIFLGFGQYDGTNASREYFNATGGNELTAWIRYPTQNFTPEDLAPMVANYIRDNHIERLNLVGVSMGTIEAIETMHDVVLYDKHDPGLRGGTTLTNEQLMPQVNYLVAYSSPGSMEDAIQGDVAHKVVSVADAVGYNGDFAGKLAYSLVVRISQDPFVMLRPSDFSSVLVNSFEDANNPSPPEMAMSELKTLDDFNIQSDPNRYQDVVNPDMKFVYISSPTDGIVRDSSSENSYIKGLGTIGVTEFSSLTTDKDHANTAASAQVFGQLLAAQSLRFYPQTTLPFMMGVTPKP